MIDFGFIYSPPEDLQIIKAACLAALLDNFKGAQSYTIAGKTITRANVGQVSAILSSVNYAIAYQSGTIRRTSVPNFNHGPCRSRW